MSPQFDAVIFDMDGLIFDTERLVRGAAQGVCRSLGFEMTDAFFASLIGLPSSESNALIQQQFGPGFPFADFDAIFRSEWTRIAALGVPVKTGAAELIAHLSASNMPLGLATSSRRASAEKHLGHAGLRDYFHIVVTRDDVARGKPHPDLFLKAAEGLDIDPARCLALEDSHNGIRAAKAAGCTVVMVPDLLEATDEIRALCLAVAVDLQEVRVMLSDAG